MRRPLRRDAPTKPAEPPATHVFGCRRHFGFDVQCDGCGRSTRTTVDLVRAERCLQDAIGHCQHAGGPWVDHCCRCAGPFASEAISGQLCIPCALAAHGRTVALWPDGRVQGVAAYVGS